MAQALSPIGPDRQRFQVHNAPGVQSVRGQQRQQALDSKPTIAISETQLGRVSDGIKDPRSEFLSLEMAAAAKQQETFEDEKANEDEVSEPSARRLHEESKKDEDAYESKNLRRMQARSQSQYVQMKNSTCTPPTRHVPGLSTRFKNAGTVNITPDESDE